MTLMNTHSKHIAALSALMALSTACAGDEPGDALEFRTTMGCTQCGVGGSNSAQVNAAYVGPFAVGSLHLSGAPNADGVTLLGLRSPGGTAHALRTDGDELVAWDTVTGAPIATGAALVGWTLELYSSSTAEPLDVQILGYDAQVPSLAEGGAPLSGYALAYEDLSTGELVPVCQRSADGPAAIAATVIRGELYDEESKDVLHAPDSLTIACLGYAAAKMKLLGYGPNQSFPGGDEPATAAQRQATLRMLTADYCGSGRPFTAHGTALAWENAAETVSTPVTRWTDIEAIWDDDGALCLSNPRLATLEEVAEHCEIPLCTASFARATPHEWTTWRVP